MGGRRPGFSRRVPRPRIQRPGGRDGKERGLQTSKSTPAVASEHLRREGGRKGNRPESRGKNGPHERRGFPVRRAQAPQSSRGPRNSRSRWIPGARRGARGAGRSDAHVMVPASRILKLTARFKKCIISFKSIFRESLPHSRTSVCAS